MDKKTAKISQSYIVPLYMNGLHGRMLRLPPPAGKSREILIIYGHRASLEQIFPLAEDLNKYGGVTVPDLPGFGGMQSFYRIGEKPTLDNLAAYLAAFIQLRYKRRRVTLVGTSFGFAVATRLLQKYPSLTKKVDLLVSAAGFVHRDDFLVRRQNYLLKRLGASLFSKRLPAWTAHNVFMRRPLLRATYSLAGSRSKPKKTSPAAKAKRLDQTVELWRKNDFRTYMQTTLAILTLDLCRQQVDLPLYHISINGPHFDNQVLEQHLNVVFKKVHILPSKLSKRSDILPQSVVALPILPLQLRRQLAK